MTNDLLDKPIAFLSALAFCLCFITVFIIGYRLAFVRRPEHLAAPPPLNPLTPNASRMGFYGLGLHCVALSALLLVISLGKLELMEWSTFRADVLYTLILIALNASILILMTAASGATAMVVKLSISIAIVFAAAYTIGV